MVKRLSRRKNRSMQINQKAVKVVQERDLNMLEVILSCQAVCGLKGEPAEFADGVDSGYERVL